MNFSKKFLFLENLFFDNSVMFDFYFCLLLFNHEFLFLFLEELIQFFQAQVTTLQICSQTFESKTSNKKCLVIQWKPLNVITLGRI